MKPYKGVIPIAKIYTSAEQLIGHTPLLELNKLAKKRQLPGKLFAKLEFLNPGGSVKDRVAKAMLDEAEKAGALVPDSVIISRPPAIPASAWRSSVQCAATVLSS